MKHHDSFGYTVLLISRQYVMDTAGQYAGQAFKSFSSHHQRPSHRAGFKHFQIIG